MTEKEFLKHLDKRLKNFVTKDDFKNFATKDDFKNFATKDDFNGLRGDFKDLKDEVTDIITDIKDDILCLKLDMGELKEEVKTNTEITQETRILVDQALKYAKDARDEAVVLSGRVEKLESA